jgi:hypothetical protein
MCCLVSILETCAHRPRAFLRLYVTASPSKLSATIGRPRYRKESTASNSESPTRKDVSRASVLLMSWRRLRFLSAPRLHRSEVGCESVADRGTNMSHLSHLGKGPSSSMMIVSKGCRWLKWTIIESGVPALPSQFGTGHWVQVPDGIDTLYVVGVR